MRGIPGVSVIGWAWASADGGDLRKILESGVSGPRDAALLYGRQPGAVGSDDRVMAWGDEGDTMPYKYGRRPPKNAPALRFGSFLSSAAPAHPRDEDYLAKLSDWQMLGNDVAGDCNAVTWANMRRLVTATLATQAYPDQAQVWEFYKTQNPGFNPAGTADTNGPGSDDDQGMSVQEGLEYLHANGGPDGVRPVAFARVNPSSVPEVEAALAIFGCLWLGIQVLGANQQQFADGQPWADVKGSPGDGGHAILAGGYA